MNKNPFRNYLECLTAANRSALPHDPVWLFYPGMLFASYAKWWADFRIRLTCHEGLDICWVKSRDEEYDKISGLGCDTRVPALADGVVINICPDFLGRSVVLEHEYLSSSAYRTVSVYSHPRAPARYNRWRQGCPRQHHCHSCRYNREKSQIPCHLHLSIMEIDKEIPLHDLDWNTFIHAGSTSVRWHNPVYGL